VAESNPCAIRRRRSRSRSKQARRATVPSQPRASPNFRMIPSWKPSKSQDVSRYTTLMRPLENMYNSQMIQLLHEDRNYLLDRTLRLENTLPATNNQKPEQEERPSERPSMTRD